MDAPLDRGPGAQPALNGAEIRDIIADEIRDSRVAGPHATQTDDLSAYQPAFYR